MKQFLFSCCSIGSERFQRFRDDLHRTIDIEFIYSTSQQWKSESSWTSDLNSHATYQSSTSSLKSTLRFRWNSAIDHFGFFVRFFNCRKQFEQFFVVSRDISRRIQSSSRDASISRRISIQTIDQHIEKSRTSSEISSTIDRIKQSIDSTRHRTTSSSRHN